MNGHSQLKKSGNARWGRAFLPHMECSLGAVVRWEPESAVGWGWRKVFRGQDWELRISDQVRLRLLAGLGRDRGAGAACPSAGSREGGDL